MESDSRIGHSMCEVPLIDSVVWQKMEQSSGCRERCRERAGPDLTGPQDGTLTGWTLSWGAGEPQEGRGQL